MKFPLRAKLITASLLAATLGLKALTASPSAYHGNMLAAAAAETMLMTAGYQTHRTVTGLGTLVRGQRGACRIMLTEYPPHGTTAEVVNGWSRRTGPLMFAWQGSLRDEAPKLQPLLTFYVQRELRRLGFHPSIKPVIAVAASAACDLDRLPWSELARISP